MNSIDMIYRREQLHFRSVPEELLKVTLTAGRDDNRTVFDAWEDWFGATHEAGHAIFAVDTGIELQWIDTDPWSIRITWPPQRKLCYSMLAAGGAATQLCVEDAGMPGAAREAAKRSADVDIKHLLHAYKGKARKYVPRFLEEMDRLVGIMKADAQVRERVDLVAIELFELKQIGTRRVLPEEIRSL